MTAVLGGRPEGLSTLHFAMDEADMHVVDPVAVRAKSGEMIDKWLMDRKK